MSLKRWYKQNLLMKWEDRKTMLKWAVGRFRDYNHLCATDGCESSNHAATALGFDFDFGKDWLLPEQKHRRMVYIVEHGFYVLDALVTLLTFALFNPDWGFRYMFLGDQLNWADEKDFEWRRATERVCNEYWESYWQRR